MPDPGPGISVGIANRATVPAKILFTNNFQVVCSVVNKSAARLGGLSFQKLKQSLHSPSAFGANVTGFVRCTNILDFIVQCTIAHRHKGGGTSRHFSSVWEGFHDDQN